MKEATTFLVWLTLGAIPLGIAYVCKFRRGIFRRMFRNVCIRPWAPRPQCPVIFVDEPGVGNVRLCLACKRRFRYERKSE